LRRRATMHVVMRRADPQTAVMPGGSCERVALHVSPALLLAAGLLAMACEGREVLVFEVPADVVGGAGVSVVTGSMSDAGADGDMMPSDSGSGGSLATGGAPGASAVPSPCTATSDCMPGWQCEMQGCDALTGECVPWPAFCRPDPAPVCGCDGVTYWNDCIRLQSYARLEGSDPCRASASPCEVGADCGVPYATCSHLLSRGEMCGHGVGACWVLPPQCPPSADPKVWRECNTPAPERPPACVDTCQAIASEQPFAQLHRNEVCN
jgi:hypothetical protein